MTKTHILFEEAGKSLENRMLFEALALYDAAEGSGASSDACSAGRWICHMLLGDYEAGWRESDAISAREAGDPYRFWSGQSLAGSRLIIRCLHGLGDTLQYVRYAKLLRSVVRELTIEAQPPLKDLLAGAGLADRVITWGDPEPPWEQQVEIVELPRIFRSLVDTIPGHVPYIVTPPALIAGAPSSRPRVGVLWASGTYDPTRSISFPQFAQISQVEECDFFSFQADPDRRELLGSSARIKDNFDPSGSILIAAQHLQTMDFVITVDTMLAHLAGALALPVWVLLPYAADWRWMVNRVDTPWYPTMRLFRQPEPRNWQAVIESVIEALRARSFNHRFAEAARPARALAK